MKQMEPPQIQLGKQLEVLDQILAERDVPVARRPLSAAMDLIQLKLIVVSTDDGKTSYEPEGSSDFLQAYWFKAIYKMVDDWFRERYSAEFDREPQTTITGVVLIRSTPFIIRIPAHRIRPAEPGKTVWLSFPEEIEPDEDSNSWLLRGPSLGQMDSDQLALVSAVIHEVGGSLRFIRTNLMGVNDSDPKGISLRHGVLTHLERAAELIASQEPEMIIKGWWDLQMALESSLKALLSQKNGHYPHSHDLKLLLSKGQAVGLSFDAAKLDGWPKPSEMSGLRYGHGGRQCTRTVFDGYRAALSLARSAAAAMTRMHLGKARFQIQRPPWMVDGLQVEIGDTPVVVPSNRHRL